MAGPLTLEALPLIAEGDYLGLGREAHALLDWIAASPRPPVALVPRRGIARDESGRTLPVSARLAGALERLGQWYGLTAITLAQPIDSNELRAAALQPGTIDRLAQVFERSIGRGLWLGGRFLVPETGGEATLDAELRLLEQPDPAWDTVRALAGRLGDDHAIAEFWDGHRVELAPLDNGRVLEFTLQRWRSDPTRFAAAVCGAAQTLVENAPGTYSLDPAGQFELIAGHDWRGRYVGRWHTHPPHYTTTGWAGAGVPSPQDLQNAVQAGQFLTFAFQPDGFVLYDAAALGRDGRADLSLLRVTRFRSAVWQARFENSWPRGPGR